VNFHAENHNYERLDQLINLQGVFLEEIVVASNVWIGSQSVILGGVKIESGAVITAGAVVTQDVPSNAVVGGVPARIIRVRGRSEVRNSA
jgi:acetyltransferase-like isoleucine patch superfamily enzyme